MTFYLFARKASAGRPPFVLSALALLASLLLSGCAPKDRPTVAGESRTTEVSQPTTIRVGAWNIEWLGTPASRSGPARNRPQSPEALAEYILASGVSVLALAEVATDSPTGELHSSIVQEAIDLVGRQTGSTWTHRLFPARSGRNQLTGLAWDTGRVSAVGEPVLLAGSDGNSSQDKPLLSRPAFGQRFSTGQGKTDFLVVALHLKSDYQGTFAVHRGEEAELMRAGIARGVGERDIILAGDFNCGAHDERAIQVLTAAGFEDLNASDLSTHVRYGPLDRILIPADQPEFQPRHFEVFRQAFLSPRNLSDEDFKIGWSDHYMVITELRIMEDDD